MKWIGPGPDFMLASPQQSVVFSYKSHLLSARIRVVTFCCLLLQEIIQNWSIWRIFKLKLGARTAVTVLLLIHWYTWL